MVKPIDYNYAPNHQHKPIDNIRDFKEYEMFLVKNGTSRPIPIVYGDVTWSEHRENLGMELRTSIPRNMDDWLIKNYDISEIGDTLIFKNKEKVIFSGMIEDIQLNRYNKEITCYDSGFLLNKKTVIKQFSKMNGAEAITNICSENGIPVGGITSMGVSITEIYKNQAISDIIKDIISKEEDKTGEPMVLEVRDNQVYVDFAKNLKINMIYKPAANVSMFDPRLTIGEIQRSDSIKETINEVIVVFEQDKSTKTVATATDADSIAKYGKRTHIESISEDEVPQASTIANNKLRELGGIKTSLTVELLGDDNVRAGRVTELNNETFKLKGDYMIENCEQRYVNNNRYMTLELKGV